MAIMTERNPEWINWIAPDQFNDKDLFRIVIFFVFHSPCENLSSMRKNLLEYGWTTPWKKPYYLNKQLRQNASTYELLFSAKGYDEMEAALEKADLKETFPSDFSRERICIYDNQGNQFLSVFYHIRNAFAHCRLNMVDVDGECVFILEDVQPKKNSNQLKVSARMILRKSTLIKWIDLIENGECEYKKRAELKTPFGTKGALLYRASPVCALCEADSPEDGSPGCFASLRSEQGAAPLAALPIPAYLAFENGFDKPFPNAKSKNRTPYIDRLPIFGRRSFSIPNIKIKEVMHYGKTENYPRTGS